MQTASAVMETINSSFPSPLLTTFLSSLIIVVCVVGDTSLAKLATYQGSEVTILRALADSSTHVLVGFFVWAVVENVSLLTDAKKWLNCCIAGILAGSVDVDHFLAGRSFHLKDALNLPSRPPFHNTTLMLFATLILMVLQRWRPELSTFTLMFFCSWFSHHLRDANHRGLWVTPLGHTPLFPSPVYIGCVILLALSARIVSVMTQRSSLKNLSRVNFVRAV